MKRFDPKELVVARSLHDDVELRHWDANHLPEDDRRLQCESWVYRARALLDMDLAEPDRQACLWILSVVRAIAGVTHLHILGLSREHDKDWALLSRATEARMLARTRKRASSQPHLKAKVVEIKVAEARKVRSFPKLVGAHLILIGGERKPTFLDRFQGDGLHLDWVPGNVRQVDGIIKSIRAGGLDGVLFLTDRNRHCFFWAVRDACTLTGTPVEWCTSGIASVDGALQRLNDRIDPMPESA